MDGANGNMQKNCLKEREFGHFGIFPFPKCGIVSMQDAGRQFHVEKIESAIFLGNFLSKFAILFNKDI